jgi:hypothetical protein
MGVIVGNASKFGRVPAPARPGPSTRIALGTFGLALLFGLGYQISLRHRRRPTRPGGVTA